MHAYSERNPFGRAITLHLNDRDEVESETPGPTHEELMGDEPDIWTDLGEAGA